MRLKMPGADQVGRAAAGLLLTALAVAGCNPGLPEAGTEQAYGGTELDGTVAPAFRLTDQHGDVVALEDFWGKVVVLVFLDSQCQETCPVTAVELRRTYQALGEVATRVGFVGVNVYLDARAVADVAAATEEWKLTEISAWHFLTGEPEALEQVWRDYFVGVERVSETEIRHTSGVYLIDQADPTTVSAPATTPPRSPAPGA